MSTPDDASADRRPGQNGSTGMDAEREAYMQPEPQGLQDFIRTQTEINKAVVERLDAIQRDVQSLKDDIGDIKGKYARYEVARDARVITLDLGVQYAREIEQDELSEMGTRTFPQGSHGSNVAQLSQCGSGD